MARGSKSQSKSSDMPPCTGFAPTRFEIEQLREGFLCEWIGRYRRWEKKPEAKEEAAQCGGGSSGLAWIDEGKAKIAGGLSACCGSARPIGKQGPPTTKILVPARPTVLTFF